MSGALLVLDAPYLPRMQPLPLLQALGWLWLGGSGAMAAAFAVSNLSFVRRLRRVRILLDDAECPLSVYTLERLPSPCLFGLVWPAVYVTPEAAADPVMLRHVLAHEYTHFRHGDHIWNILWSIALTIHWYTVGVWQEDDLLWSGIASDTHAGRPPICCSPGTERTA